MSRFWIILCVAVVLLVAARFIMGEPPAARLNPAASVAPVAVKAIEKPKALARGIWVTVFSKYKILYSKPAVTAMVAYCRQNHIDEIYLQIYRSGEAYYDSQLAGRKQYEAMIKEAGGDALDFLLHEAHQNNIKVYAWVNILSLAQNRNAPIVQKYGPGVFTRDQHLRGSIRTDGIDHSDKFYLRDDQIFLEPGDDRVVTWSLAVVDEIIKRYPDFDGLHLDYMRYPFPVPSIPDGRFVEFGLAYGYGERNLARFTKASGLDPIKEDPFQNAMYLKWDGWKREQVTELVSAIAGLVRAKKALWEVSCAVVPTEERAYSLAFQDWPLWLEKGLLDKVVLMNYTRDPGLSEMTLKGALAFRGRGKVYSGLGVFLLKDPAAFRRIYDKNVALSPDGVVFFSYDDLQGMDAVK